MKNGTVGQDDEFWNKGWINCALKGLIATESPPMTLQFIKIRSHHKNTSFSKEVDLIVIKITYRWSIVSLWLTSPFYNQKFLVSLRGVYDFRCHRYESALTDIWHHPQERKSGVALWRWDVGATGQKGPGGGQEITCFAWWVRLRSHQI